MTKEKADDICPQSTDMTEVKELPVDEVSVRLLGTDIDDDSTAMSSNFDPD